ncbi:hypothetical protein [Pedobacter terrae]|uniref:hypothetical protein n=1 Tax=Pedobacter terrae TaxID=405671 RepID=UPI002FFC4A4B
MMKSVSKTVDQDGDPFSDETMTYTYQYDAKGNATSLNYVNTSTFYPSGRPDETENYTGKFLLTYNCKQI